MADDKDPDPQQPPVDSSGSFQVLTPLVATAQNTGVPIIAAMSSEEQEAAKVVDAWITGEGRTTGNYKDKPVDRVTTDAAILY